MATRLPPVHALTAFESAARHSSFAVAAEELCITPSALSHRIRLLEEFVGERLFNRDGRGVGLSEFGRRYLEVVRSALRTLSDFPIPHKAAPVQARIKLTLPPAFARHIFLPRLHEFYALHPDIIVEIYLSVPLYDVSIAESDIEVRFGAGRYPNVAAEKLFHEPAFVVASPKYLATIPPLKVPADLQHATLLRSALEPWQPWFETAGLDWSEPSTTLRIDDLGLLLEAVRLGHGVGLSRQHFVQEMMEKGEVVPVFDLQLESPQHAYYMVFDRQIHDRPEINILVAWLEDTFGNRR